MKYHEKLNLKSPIYKYSNNNTSRTPTKSPIKPSVNPVELFQKVCCPNCKYAFKIIKQEILKENPLEITTLITKKSRIKEKKSIEVQTENDPVITVKNSPTKSSKSPIRSARSPGLHSNQNIDNYKMNKLSEILHAENTENRRLREPEFKFKPLSVSPNDKIMKSKSLLKTLDPKILSSDSLRIQESTNYRDEFELTTPNQGKFSLSLNESMQERERTDENYLQSPRKSSEKFTSNQRRNTHREILSQEEDDKVLYNRNRSQTGVENIQDKRLDFNKKESNHDIVIELPVKIEEKVCCRCKDNSDFNNFILSTIIENTQNKQAMTELKEFCNAIGEEVEVPSYCKMLALSE